MLKKIKKQPGGSPVPQKLGMGGNSLLKRAFYCFLVLWMICGICLAGRCFGQISFSREFVRDGKAVTDVFVLYDFACSDKDGHPIIMQAGERLARQGEEITPDKAVQLENYANSLQKKHSAYLEKRLGNFIQSLVLLGLMLWCFVFCLYSMRPHFFRRLNMIALCSVLVFLHFGLITLCFLLWQKQTMLNSMQLLACLPLYLVPALATLLLGARISICLMLLLTSLTALLLEGDFQFVLFQYSMFCSLVGIAAYSKVTRYRQLFWRCGGMMASILLLDAFVLWHRQLLWPVEDLIVLFNNIRGMAFWTEWSWASLSMPQIPVALNKLLLTTVVNGLGSTIALLIYTKGLERFFEVVSPITLRGLDEQAHPLLEQMHREAEGTDEHCKAVADMAYDAAEAIDANKFLARVSGRFHDIGKLGDPTCFAENCFGGESPHQQLTPFESCNRIRKHVTYGAELGRRYHLPLPIIEAIRTHHGDDLVTYFYKKAVKEAEQQNVPPPGERCFRYDAPLPHRKEAVIVEIADICEAAFRAELLPVINTVDYQAVKQLVDKLVMSKMQHRQFAEADITLAELTVICDSMCRSLAVKYHVRPKYSEEPPPVTRVTLTSDDAISVRMHAVDTDSAPLKKDDVENYAADKTSAEAADGGQTAENAKGKTGTDAAAASAEKQATDGEATTASEEQAVAPMNGDEPEKTTDTVEKQVDDGQPAQ